MKRKSVCVFESEGGSEGECKTGMGKERERQREGN